MDKLKIVLLQSRLSWEDPERNLRHFDKRIAKIKKDSADIIVLPEMFNTGFTMNAKQMAETMQGETVGWMKAHAISKNAAVCGSLIVKEKGKFYNRLVWTQPDGEVLWYDKRHLFRLASEHKTFSQGKKKLLFSFRGWKIFPLVCYDLRFPVWSRSDGTVDLILFVANWPEKRSYAWKQLLIARAIENQCFVAGLNRVGEDGKNIHYSGDSVILDPAGEPVVDFVSQDEKNIKATLRRKKLSELRKIFPVAMDRDQFRIL